MEFRLDDYTIIDDLDSLYIETRYPSGMGLLPYGKPSLEDIQMFYDFACKIFNRACEMTKVDSNIFIK